MAYLGCLGSTCYSYRCSFRSVQGSSASRTLLLHSKDSTGHRHRFPYEGLRHVAYLRHLVKKDQIMRLFQKLLRCPAHTQPHVSNSHAARDRKEMLVMSRVIPERPEKPVPGNDNAGLLHGFYMPSQARHDACQPVRGLWFRITGACILVKALSAAENRYGVQLVQLVHSIPWK